MGRTAAGSSSRSILADVLLSRKVLVLSAGALLLFNDMYGRSMVGCEDG
jgi:hypothetical protein